MRLSQRGNRIVRGAWFLFIVVPLLQTLGAEPAPWERAAAWSGVLLAAAFYLPFFLRAEGGRGDRWDVVQVVGLELVAVSLVVALGPVWAITFIFATVAGALRLPHPWALRCVVAGPVLVVACSAVSRVDDPGDVIGYATSAAGIGTLMLIIGRLREANVELAAARAALAERAVAEERTRFARDLHDLLGHSLSVIALKSELAGRLLERDPAAAAQHVEDVEQIARDALVEVREAVSGYRRPTLAGELAGARLALEAAGVRAELEDRTTALAPEAEAVLAWAVREGVTNVVRHAHAGTCAVVVTDDGVTVRDDGAGGAEGIGNGLAGLRERVEAVRGSLDAGRPAEGGFRLGGPA